MLIYSIIVVTKMQTTQLKVVNRLTSLKHFIRTLSVTSDIKPGENLKSWREVPGPKSLPILGQLHHFFPGGELKNFEDVGAIQTLFDKYGPLVRFDGMFGMGGMIFISDPEITAYVRWPLHYLNHLHYSDITSEILRSENLSPVRPGFVSLEYYRKNYKRSKGHVVGTTGLMTEQGDVWKEFRSTVNSVMLQPKTIKLYNTVLDEVAMNMINRLKVGRDEKNMLQNTFDIEMNLWALESIGTVALGCRLNCLDSTLPEDSPEKQLIQCIHDLFHVSAILDFRPSVWRYVSTPLFKKAMKMYEHHENLTKYFLKKGMEQLKLKQETEHEKGILEKLLEINEEYGYIMASDMLFAGVDTAANTMTGVLYLLAANQDKQDKLREEILSKSERRPYLKACIKEGLRLMPVVAGNFRRSTKEYNVNGYRIPKDMNIVFSHREMSLSDLHYLRAKEFIPERWTVDKNDPLYYGNAHPFVYGPFGFGTRSCIGRRIAELEVETFLARVIENFKVEWFGPPPKQLQSTISYITGPFNFIFKDLK